MIKKILFFIILFCLSESTFAQSEEENAIKSVITQLFNGMQKHDSTLIRTYFHTSARMQVISENRKTGLVEIKTQNTIDNFVKNIGNLPLSSQIEERALNMEIRIDGQLATAWTKYEFLRNGTISHCGIDAFQFYKSNEGWKILTLTYNVKKCE
jgi:archaellum component FlaG (FlaF/FlaG flagellin family)